MNDALTRFPPTRTAALERLSEFVPKAGRAYATNRNYDLGPGGHHHVSQLSPYLRHRLLTEEEVLQAVLGHYALSSAEKFVQEVVWRTYWKGWLELRPSVWDMYQADLTRAWDRVQTESGLRREWEAACMGETGIDAFDHWAHELVQTGYLHNHARMWFASIWVFTLRLPWELGADFFLRHLLDGDAASNTLGWRWVAGLQTQGKTYLARPDNIAKYTEGRFKPAGLASFAAPLDGPPHPPRQDPPVGDSLDPGKPSVLLLTDDDLSPGFLFDAGLDPTATGVFTARAEATPLQLADHVHAFMDGAFDDVAARWGDRLGEVSRLTSAQEIVDWARAHGAEQVVTPHAPVGATARALDRAEALTDDAGMRLVRCLRDYDAGAWPHATHGFFRFKEKIPRIVGRIKGLRAA